MAFAFQFRLVRHGVLDLDDRTTYCQLIERYFVVLDWVNLFINIRIGLTEMEDERRLQEQTVLIIYMISSRSSLI